MADLKEMLAKMDTRQKATIGVFVIIVAVIVWQVMGLFGGGGGSAPAANAQAAVAKPAMPTPKPAPVAAAEQPAQLSQDEQEMQRVLKETQAKYIAAVNEVQLMKVAEDMADINAKIMKSKEDAVTSQKKIVDMLTLPDQSGVQQPATTGDGQSASGQAQQQGGLIQKDVTYTVVSISQLQGKWGAVLSYGSNLYSVHVGDVLPADSSSVISINKSSVVLEKDGMRSKLSMVSVI